MTKTRSLHRDDLPELVDMIGGLAAHHADTAHINVEHLVRDTCGPSPWFTVIVAQGPARILQGYAAMTRIGQLQFGVRGMDIHHLFVRSDVRGTGVGRALVNACVSNAKKQACGYVSVGTHPDNHDAGAFYETLGFIRRPGAASRFSMRLEGAAYPPT